MLKNAIDMEKIDLGLDAVECMAFADDNPQVVMVQMLDDNETGGFEGEAGMISEGTGGLPMLIAGVKVNDWEAELAPWPDLHLSKRPEVGRMAHGTLEKLATAVCPALRSRCGAVPMILGGYSLAGLFALWAATQTDAFQGVAAMSPSLWIEGWDAFSEANACRARCAYLSLGDREERTKNPVFRRVGDCVRREGQRLAARLGEDNATLVWNKGNHFQHNVERTAAGFVWCAKHLTKN